MTLFLQQQEIMVRGFAVLIDHQLGHMMVAHDGTIGWEDLQAIKNEVWGRDARAIEVYPRAADVVNSGNFRHLWRLGSGDFCPDLLKHEPRHLPRPDGLQHRHSLAWRAAEEAFA